MYKMLARKYRAQYGNPQGTNPAPQGSNVAARMRRKYLAQYGNSSISQVRSGSTVTCRRPLHQSVNTSSYLHNKRQCCGNIVKNVPNRSASEKIEYAKVRTLKCSIDLSANQYVAKLCNNRGGQHDTYCSNVVVTKNVRVAIGQGQQIENVKAAVACSGNFWGAAPLNNAC